MWLPWLNIQGMNPSPFCQVPNYPEQLMGGLFKGSQKDHCSHFGGGVPFVWWLLKESQGTPKVPYFPPKIPSVPILSKKQPGREKPWNPKFVGSDFSKKRQPPPPSRGPHPRGIPRSRGRSLARWRPPAAGAGGVATGGARLRGHGRAFDSTRLDLSVDLASKKSASQKKASGVRQLRCCLLLCCFMICFCICLMCLFLRCLLICLLFVSFLCSPFCSDVFGSPMFGSPKKSGWLSRLCFCFCEFCFESQTKSRVVLGLVR